jgi:Ca2+-binding RTX toxin-like protein
MPNVTVASGHGTTVSVPIGSLQNAQIAAQALASISQGVIDGTITPYFSSGFGVPSVPAGPSVLFLTGPGSVAIPGSTGTLVDDSTKPDVLFGGNAAEQLVVSGKGGITYYVNTGAGTVIAGGGDNTIITALSGGGDHLILTDAGDDKILSFSGNNTISAGLGDNSILLGTGNDSVQVTGHDIINAGSGTSTITVVTGNAVVYGGTGQLTFTNGNEASTVFGGTGSATVTGGGGGGVFHGGLGGNNLLIGGEAATTLFGGGNGDMLLSVGKGNDLLSAGTGNETLLGIGSGADTFRGGSGSDMITGGAGKNTIVAGSGAETLTGGPSGNDYEFINGQAGGNVEITDFMKGADTLTLLGYGHDALKDAIKDATKTSDSITITLPDDTSITFLGITDLSGVGGGGGGGGGGCDHDHHGWNDQGKDHDFRDHDFHH